MITGHRKEQKETDGDREQGNIGGFSPKRLRGHRDRLRLSRRQLGELIGRSASAIIGYEMKGDMPTVAALVRMAEVLGILPNELMRMSMDDEHEYKDALDPNTRHPMAVQYMAWYLDTVGALRAKLLDDDHRALSEPKWPASQREPEARDSHYLPGPAT